MRRSTRAGCRWSSTPPVLPARKRLTEPTFIDAFLDKGRMRPLLETMPARLILGDTVGLLGAARYATS